MHNVNIKINILHTFYIITLLFVYLISYSKTANANPVNLKNFRKLQKYPRYDDYDIFYKCEELREKNKNLENNITMLKKKNRDYNLQIEVNLIYIKMLYILISILFLAIIIIIIVKFYFQCQKRKKTLLNVNSTKKSENNFLEENNEISNQTNIIIMVYNNKDLKWNISISISYELINILNLKSEQTYFIYFTLLDKSKKYLILFLINNNYKNFI